MKPTSKTSKVRLFNRPTSAPIEGISTRYGTMLPSPQYSHYAALSDLHDALAALHSDMAGMALTKTEALARLESLPMPASTYSSIEQAVAGLRSALTEGGDIPRYLTLLQSGIGQLATAVMFAAGDVPRPVSPDAVQPVVGQRLGSGAYQRSMND